MDKKDGLIILGLLAAAGIALAINKKVPDWTIPPPASANIQPCLSCQIK